MLTYFAFNALQFSGWQIRLFSHVAAMFVNLLLNKEDCILIKNLSKISSNIGIRRLSVS